MIDQLNAIEQEALSALQTVNSKDALESWRTMYLGKKSPLMTMLGDLGKLSREERPAIGKRGNEVKNALEAAYANRMEAIRKAELQHSLTAGALDVAMICLLMEFHSGQEMRKTRAVTFRRPAGH